MTAPTGIDLADRFGQREDARRDAGRGLVTMNVRNTRTLSVRLAGSDVQLECVCDFTIVQPLRAPIAEFCPKCRRRWR